MGVYIWNDNYSNYSAMQGPAPSGFHVPLSSEWQGLKTIMDGLSLTTSDDWKINLHLPFAGRRIVNASTNNQGVYAYYWSSSPYGSAYSWLASGLLLSSSISTNSSGTRSDGRSVRCFNNSFIAPTSSWTVITGTLGGAGIFRNQTEGLISITSDGITGYTIQDKNLGATTVYNDGDTLSEANCGKYYQWGNNYGFLRTGDITTSSTQVNASAYGPGNYYSSSTFITGSTDRSSVHNDNLWGGVTGVTHTSDLKNAYIGEYRGYTPNSNTIGYYPLKSDFNDASGNGYNLTVSDATITTQGGIACASYSNGRAYNSSAAVGTKRTLSAWVYNITTSGDPVIIGTGANQTSYYGMFIALSGGTVQISDFHAVGKSGGSLTQNTWHHIVGVVDNTSMKLYVDGVLKGSTTHNRTDASTGISVGGKPFTDQYNNNCTGYISEAIIENAAWTADQVANYFNGIKYKYGIS